MKPIPGTQYFTYSQFSQKLWKKKLKFIAKSIFVERLYLHWKKSFFLVIYQQRGFRLSQRSHLRTLNNFVSEKSGKRCEKSGETLWKSRKCFEESGKHCEKSGKCWIKSGNQKILRRFIFFLYPRLEDLNLSQNCHSLWNSRFFHSFWASLFIKV